MVIRIFEWDPELPIVSKKVLFQEGNNVVITYYQGDRVNIVDEL